MSPIEMHLNYLESGNIMQNYSMLARARYKPLLFKVFSKYKLSLLLLHTHCLASLFRCRNLLAVVEYCLLVSQELLKDWQVAKRS